MGICKRLSDCCSFSPKAPRPRLPPPPLPPRHPSSALWVHRDFLRPNRGQCFGLSALCVCVLAAAGNWKPRPESGVPPGEGSAHRQAAGGAGRGPPLLPLPGCLPGTRGLLLALLSAQTLGAGAQATREAASPQHGSSPGRLRIEQPPGQGGPGPGDPLLLCKACTSPARSSWRGQSGPSSAEPPWLPPRSRRLVSPRSAPQQSASAGARCPPKGQPALWGPRAHSCWLHAHLASEIPSCMGRPSGSRRPTLAPQIPQDRPVVQPSEATLKVGPLEAPVGQLPAWPLGHWA